MVLASVLPAKFFSDYIYQNKLKEFEIYWNLWFKINIYLSQNISLERQQFNSQISGFSGYIEEQELTTQEKLEILRSRLKIQEAEIDVIIE
jgi:hypothetical protein